MADASSAQIFPVKYSYSVILEGGPPWGIRLQGGYEFAQKLRVAKVNPNSKAYRQGVQTGDLVDTINGSTTEHMNHRDALRLFQNSNGKLVIELTRTEKQSAIPILRVESPAELRNSESDLEQVDLSECVRNNIGVVSSMTSCHDDLHLTDDPETTSRTQSSAVIWSPVGYNQTKTYQPVLFDSNGRNQRERRRRDYDCAPSLKGYESADEILISKSFPISLKSLEIPGRSIQSGKRRHPRHVSDPGFDPKQSLRPPISDFIQLSRRSRQFNFWNQFYPRNFSDPEIVAPTTTDAGNPASTGNNCTRPPVFTSVEEFQKHYGSCYSRTLPLRKRYTVAPTISQNGTPQTKHVQFAPEGLQVQPPLFYDSDDAITTFPRAARARKRTVSPVAPSAESNSEDENLLSDPLVLKSHSTESDSPDAGRPDASENITSSLKINLASSNGERIQSEGKIFKQKTLKDKRSVESEIQNLVNSIKFAAGDAATSADLVSPTDTVGMATARLELVRSELPKPQSSVLTLLKKNRGETTHNFAQPLTDSVEPKASQNNTHSIQRNATENQSSPKASQSNITSIRTTAKASLPNNSNQEFLDEMGDLSGDSLHKAGSNTGQKDWYNQVVKPVHMADQVIPPRPKVTQTIGGASGGLCNSQSDDKSKEKAGSGSAVRAGIIEIAPCGVRYISKPDRSVLDDSNSKLIRNQKSSFRSTLPLPSAEFRNREVVKQTTVEANQRILSPRLSDPTLIRDRNSYLFKDEYWLALAGLGSVNEREWPSVAHPTIPAVSPDKSASRSSYAKAIALYSFKTKSEKELSFNDGDIVYIIRSIDKNWYEAELNAAVGLVPCSYVKIVDDLERQERTLVKVIAKHDFTAKYTVELSFNKGDILTVIRRIDSNWYEGRTNKRTGIFPVSYVESLSGPLATVSPGTGNIVPTAAPPQSSLTSPYNNAYDDTLCDLSKDVLEFDKLFENCQNLNAPKTEQRNFVNDSEQSLTLPSANWTRTPADATKYNTISISSSIREPTMASDVKRNSDSTLVQQKFQADPRRGTSEKSATSSLHLLYEEPWYQVLYNYAPQHDDELDLCEGDLIYLLERCDDGWCVGQSDRTKRVGTFPNNYVKQLG